MRTPRVCSLKLSERNAWTYVLLCNRMRFTPVMFVYQWLFRIPRWHVSVHLADTDNHTLISIRCSILYIGMISVMSIVPIIKWAKIISSHRWNYCSLLYWSVIEAVNCSQILMKIFLSFMQETVWKQKSNLRWSTIHQEIYFISSGNFTSRILCILSLFYIVILRDAR